MVVGLILYSATNPSGPGLLITEVSKSHSDPRTQQGVSGRGITFSGSERPQTYTLDGEDSRSICNRNLQYSLRNPLNHKVERKCFLTQEKNKGEEENSRMWNGTLFRPFLEQLLLIAG